jgi:hypothetical protein
MTLETYESVHEFTKAFLTRTNMSHKKAIDDIGKYYTGFGQPQLDRFIREDRRVANYNLDEVLAVVRAFSEFSNETLRLTATEALHFLQLTKVEIKHYPRLLDYFPRPEYEAAWEDFLKTIDAPGPEPETPTAAVVSLPPYPHFFIGREHDVVVIEDRLGITAGSQRQPRTIIRGWPGVGKTTFVQHLVYNEQVRKAFHDGVLWGTIGKSQGKVFETLRKWGRELGLLHMQSLQTVDELMAAMRAYLLKKRILLVVDDLWEAEDGNKISELMTPDTTLVMTTRFTDLAEDWSTSDNEIYSLPVLTNEKAIEFLELLAPAAVREHYDQITGLVEALEGLPLALRVTGSYLREESKVNPVNVSALIHDLQTNFAPYANRPVQSYMTEETGITPTIELLFQRSVETLQGDEQEAFIILGAFAPKPATFNADAMQAMWEIDDPYPYIRRLVGRGLLEPVSDKPGRFQMHATLAGYAKSLMPKGS